MWFGQKEPMKVRNFRLSTAHVKFHKICTLIGPFCWKYINLSEKKYRGLMPHGTEEWCKIWRKIDLWFGKWHEEYGKFSPEQLKVSKLAYWWDPLIQSRKSVSLKSTEKLCVMTMKNDAKFEEELTCYFKIETTLWQNLNWAFECLKNLHFNEILLTKIYNIWAKKVLGSYVCWHWRLM